MKRNKKEAKEHERQAKLVSLFVAREERGKKFIMSFIIDFCVSAMWLLSLLFFSVLVSLCQNISFFHDDWKLLAAQHGEWRK